MDVLDHSKGKFKNNMNLDSNTKKIIHLGIQFTTDFKGITKLNLKQKIEIVKTYIISLKHEKP